MSKSARLAPLVLIVDDYPDAREMYAEFFEISGFRVAQAGSGGEAVDRAVAMRPDVVLMDLSLPGMDGWEATRALKADERTRHAVVVAVTGHAGAAASATARASGCDGFVEKPCTPDAVVAEVNRLLDGRLPQPPVPSPQAPAPSP